MFSPEVEAAARAHAVAEFPKESCGVIVDGKYQPIANIAEDPGKDFVMPDDTWLKYKVEGVVHSHGPQFALAPSGADMEHQISTNVPWGITKTDGVGSSKILWWGDFRLDEELLGRQFIHGVTDCYSAIRSWRWQNCKIKIPDFARDDQWWANDRNLYIEYFVKAGYREIAVADVKPGDVGLMQVRSKVFNHGGTLLESSLFYHHLQNRMSCREPVGRWMPLISKWLRYEG